MKRLIKPLMFLVAVQVVIILLGRVLKGRYLSQEIEEGEFNAVGVSGGADEKVVTTDFKGGYLRAVTGGVKLDLTEANIVDPPATIDMTVVMGGAKITVPEGWIVKVETRNKLAGVHDAHVSGVSDDEAVPDLVLTGKVMMGGAAIADGKTDIVVSLKGLSTQSKSSHRSRN